jgi:mycothiol synthase
LNAGVDLPTGWTTRRPALDDDVPAILAMVHASDIAAVGHPDFTADDVREALTSPHVDPALDAWLAVTPDGTLAGWAYLENPNAGDREFIEVYVHPEYGVPALRPLLALVLARVAERAAAFGHPEVTVRGGGIPNEESWLAALREAGFGFVKRYARMRRTLTDLPPEPALPDGVTVRLLRAEDDADQRDFHRILDTAFRDTPDYVPLTFEQWRERVAALPSVTWDEWFVASVDGVPAGILQSADQALDQNEGWVKHLAVLAEHRRRGLGAALLARAFATYAAKGRDTAGLGVDLTNPTRAANLYTAMGMSPAFEVEMYERTVTAAGYGEAVRVGRDRSPAT